MFVCVVIVDLCNILICWLCYLKFTFTAGITAVHASVDFNWLSCYSIVDLAMFAPKIMPS